MSPIQMTVHMFKRSVIAHFLFLGLQISLQYQLNAHKDRWNFKLSIKSILHNKNK